MPPLFKDPAQRTCLPDMFSKRPGRVKKYIETAHDSLLPQDKIPVGL